MKKKSPRKISLILSLLCITIILSTIATCFTKTKAQILNQSQIIEKLEKANYEFTSSNNKISIYTKKQNSEETINIKISKKTLIFEYTRNTQEYEYLTSVIKINKKKKRIPKVLRVTGTNSNQSFNFQYYIEEDRLEYNPNNYLPADAWQISQNILTYYSEVENLLL